MRRRWTILVDRLRSWWRGLPPAALRQWVGPSDFEATGREFAGYLTRFAGFTPSSSVLDVGCGVGRMARPLTGMILRPAGWYEGFDVAPDAIAWCQRHLTRRHPHFQFRCVNVYNATYNPLGTLDPATFRFPADGARFDVALAASVFTHLLPETTMHYVQELARVMKPGGRALLTFFLLNDSARSGLAAGTSTQPFRFHVGHQALTTHAERPEVAMAYEEPWVLQQLAEAGFRFAHPIQYGSWPGRAAFLSYQDVLVVER